MRRLLAGLVVSTIAFGAWAGSAYASPQTRLVEKARLTVESFLGDPEFPSLPVYVRNAFGVLIAPEQLKAGFFFGAEFGSGVLLARNPASGQWGPPAFVDLYGGSFGVQFGGQSASAIYLIMNEEALDKILTSKVKLGASAGMTAGPVGRGIGAETTLRMGEDVYHFSKSRGLFGGLAFDGAVVLSKDDWNAAYYGRPLGAAEIVRSNVETAYDAPLRAALRRFELDRTAFR